MQILIGADLVPTESNFDLFKAGDAMALVGAELLDVLKKSDYRIFNLEVPLCDELAPIEKCGPALIAPTNTVEGYKAIGADLLTLANNHILDQGASGLESTIKMLDANRIAHVGSGVLSEARKPSIIDICGKKIGVYACAEHEFSIAGENMAGANPFDPLESLDHILDMKKECDYVIVLYHGGKEHYRYPSPNLQKVCRKMVEKGADLVVCQHSHCIGCEEKYGDGTIVYGQGNFLFDHSASEFWQTSLLIELNETGEVSYIPLKKHGNGVRLAEGGTALEIMEGFSKRSEEIKQEGFIEEQYEKFAASMIERYLSAFCGIKRTFFYKVLDKLSGHRLTKWILKRKYSGKGKLALRNYIECEAHRELLLNGLCRGKS